LEIDAYFSSEKPHVIAVHSLWWWRRHWYLWHCFWCISSL